MRNAILASILAVVLMAGAAVVYAGPPIAGTYKSTDGDFDEGTATTFEAGGGYFANANYIYGQSSSGGVFTNDWTVCAQVQNALKLVAKVGPTGIEIWQITYTGSGYVTLGGPGNPWDGGDAVYTGIVDSYVEIRTVSFVNNSIVGAVSDHAISAHLQGYDETCVAWAIGNGSLRGGNTGIPPFTYPTLQSVKPAGYPGYAGFSCTPGPNGSGHWDDIRDLTLSITGCTVATEQKTWGGVKSMYRN